MSDFENSFFKKIRGWAKSARAYRTDIHGVRQGMDCFDAMETVLGIMTSELEPEFNLAGTNRKEARTEQKASRKRKPLNR